MSFPEIFFRNILLLSAILFFMRTFALEVQIEASSINLQRDAEHHLSGGNIQTLRTTVPLIF
jgi:hypothetical protein